VTSFFVSARRLRTLAQPAILLARDRTLTQVAGRRGGAAARFARLAAAHLRGDLLQATGAALRDGGDEWRGLIAGLRLATAASLAPPRRGRLAPRPRLLEPDRYRYDPRIRRRSRAALLSARRPARPAHDRGARRRRHRRAAATSR
jgi:hypothetical protein